MNMTKFILGYNLHLCESFRDIDVKLFCDELRMQSTRADNLLERTQSASSLMQDIISFRGLDALNMSSENPNEMARLADIDNKNMVKLTVKSRRDAQTMKKISILTTVYLPASFVSVSLPHDELAMKSFSDGSIAISQHGIHPGALYETSAFVDLCRGNVDLRCTHLRSFDSYIGTLVVRRLSEEVVPQQNQLAQSGGGKCMNLTKSNYRRNDS
ncbi:hypothetical protein K469DRAFT_688647 [Zopfia rhizophila CBS 207.26]|uniref:Uncharacterized protein n=1 Tax=Zopfia rhizophila CBS 207.26 TaxID=1314779 RepID=A0A6A6E1R1_9PEZI|nr:hypothetical protein K469DRAFT_688647 [Zopfia rhizophila CBS 207.26]